MPLPPFILIKKNSNLRGDIAAFLLVALMLFLLGLTQWAEYVAMIFFCWILPKRKWWLLSFGTIWSWFFTRDLKWYELTNVMRSGSNSRTSESLIFQSLIVGGVLLICFMYLTAIERFRVPRYQAFVLMIIIYLGTLFSLPFIPIDSCLGVLIWATVFVFQQFIWHLGYAIIDRDPSRQNAAGIFQQLTLFKPFWVNGYNVPIPGGTRELSRLESFKPNQASALRWQGVRLLAWVLFVSFACDFVSCLLGIGGLSRNLVSQAVLPARLNPYNQMILRSIRDFQFLGRNGDTFDFFARWIGVLTLTYLRVFRNFLVPTGIGVSMLRFVGFDVLPHVQNPLRADIFSHYFSRWLYYYNQIISQFFLLPIFVRMRFSNRKLRLFTSVFISVFLTGWIYHIGGGHLSLLAHGGVLELLNGYECANPYFILLSLAVATSATFEFPIAANSWGVGRALRMGIYILVFAVILYLSFVIDLVASSPDFAKFLRFFSSLFVVGGPI